MLELTSKDGLRQELGELHNALLLLQSEEHCSSEDARRTEEQCQLEFSSIAAQLDSLDTELLMEFSRQETESRLAQDLLEEVHVQVMDMGCEVLQWQAAEELLETESMVDAAHLRLLSTALQQSATEEQALQDEFLDLQRTKCLLSQNLLALHQDEIREEFEEAHYGKVMEEQAAQICKYEDWSQGVHQELRQVASELQADRAAGAKERQLLLERVAHLEHPSTLDRHSSGSALHAENQIGRAANSSHPSIDSCIGYTNLKSEKNTVLANLAALPQTLQQHYSLNVAKCRVDHATATGQTHYAEHEANISTWTGMQRQAQFTTGEYNSHAAALWCRKRPQQLLQIGSNAPSLS